MKFRPRAEQLEDRTSPATLFLDFSGPAGSFASEFARRGHVPGGVLRLLDFRHHGRQRGRLNGRDLDRAAAEIVNRVQALLPWLHVAALDVRGDTGAGERVLADHANKDGTFVVFVGGRADHWGDARTAPPGRNLAGPASVYAGTILDYGAADFHIPTPVWFAQTVAGVVAHEAGHLLGLHDTDPADENVMAEKFAVGFIDGFTFDQAGEIVRSLGEPTDRP